VTGVTKCALAPAIAPFLRGIRLRRPSTFASLLGGSVAPRRFPSWVARPARPFLGRSFVRSDEIIYLVESSSDLTREGASTLGIYAVLTNRSSPKLAPILSISPPNMLDAIRVHPSQWGSASLHADRMRRRPL